MPGARASRAHQLCTCMWTCYAVSGHVLRVLGMGRVSGGYLSVVDALRPRVVLSLVEMRVLIAAHGCNMCAFDRRLFDARPQCGSCACLWRGCTRCRAYASPVSLFDRPQPRHGMVRSMS